MSDMTSDSHADRHTEPDGADVECIDCLQTAAVLASFDGRPIEDHYRDLLAAQPGPHA